MQAGRTACHPGHKRTNRISTICELSLLIPRIRVASKLTSSDQTPARPADARVRGGSKITQLQYICKCQPLVRRWIWKGNRKRSSRVQLLNRHTLSHKFWMASIIHYVEYEEFAYTHPSPFTELSHDSLRAD